MAIIVINGKRLELDWSTSGPFYLLIVKVTILDIKLEQIYLIIVTSFIIWDKLDLEIQLNSGHEIGILKFLF